MKILDRGAGSRRAWIARCESSKGEHLHPPEGSAQPLLPLNRAVRSPVLWRHHVVATSWPRRGFIGAPPRSGPRRRGGGPQTTTWPRRGAA
eukprot:scaffold19664_cov66-Phaeocystis_antarctica.AAC.1